MTISIRSIQWIPLPGYSICCSMALPLFQLSSSLFKASIKPPLLCSTASTSTLYTQFLNPCTNPNAKFVPLIKTSLSCSVAEAEVQAAPAAVENEQKSNNRLIAQNIPWTTGVDDIKALFGKHGTVVDIEFSMYNKVKNRGLAFVTMLSAEEASAAIISLNKTEYSGRTIKVEYARSPKKQPQPPAAQGPKFKYSVYVGNLPFNARSQDLREFFQKNGQVVSVQIIYNSRPRRSAGYGFATFYSKEEAELAIETFNEQEFMGRPLRMGYAKEISTEDKIDGGSTENETTDTQDNAEKETSVSEEMTIAV